MTHGNPTAYTPDGLAVFHDGAVCRARDWLAYEQGMDDEPCYHLPRFTREEFTAMVKAWHPEDWTPKTRPVAMFDPPLHLDALDAECGASLFDLALDHVRLAEEREQQKQAAYNLPDKQKRGFARQREVAE